MPGKKITGQSFLVFFFYLQLDSEIIEFKTQYPPRYLRIWLGGEDVIPKLSPSVIFLWLSKFWTIPSTMVSAEVAWNSLNTVMNWLEASVFASAFLWQLLYAWNLSSAWVTWLGDTESWGKQMAFASEPSNQIKRLPKRVRRVDSCAQLWTVPVSSTGALAMSQGTEVSFPAVSGMGKGPFLTASSLSCSAPLAVAEGCRRAPSTASSRAGLPRAVCCGRSLQCCGPVTPTSVQLLPREVKDPASHKSVFLLSGVFVQHLLYSVMQLLPKLSGVPFTSQSTLEEPSWELCKAHTSRAVPDGGEL